MIVGFGHQRSLNLIEIYKWAPVTPTRWRKVAFIDDSESDSFSQAIVADVVVGTIKVNQVASVATLQTDFVRIIVLFSANSTGMMVK